MFLKKIKIDGFKSFAKPITIDFNSPLTAIVGPNGSGKSNIVDAIRWVLGEQSPKTLRGSRMADVIFAGSDDHKPLNKASVTLYLNNEDDILPIDDDEVKIARRVNQDGESDYILNDKVCRLKDIKELLLDTGLGQDSYSIVGQGKIDSIINSKPGKLRELFEEAAGITKHKARKAEAEKRLDKTNQNLQRVDDLISELDKQVKPLKESAEKAKKYKRLFGELKRLDISLLLTRWEKNLDKLETAKEEKIDIDSEISAKTREHEKIVGLLEDKKEELQEKEEKHEELKTEYNKLKTKIEEINNNLKILQERRENLKRERTNLNEQVDELHQEKDELIERLEGVENEIEQLNNKIEKIKNQKQKEEDNLEKIEDSIKNKKQEISSLRSHILDEDGEMRDLDLEKEKLKEKINLQVSKIDDLKREKIEIDDRLKSEEKKIEKIKDELGVLKNKRQKKNDVIESNHQKKKELEEKLAEMNQKYQKINDKLTKKQSEYELLQGMEEDYNGYYKGVKNILKRQDDFSGIIGVVADLIQVNEEYEQAIETALGAKLQNIVVEDDDTAQKCVEYLKKNRAGRATFLPLNMVQGNKFLLSDEIRNMPGFLGLAVDLVSFNITLKPVVEQLLGRIIVTDNLEHARAISKKMNSKLKVVTREGNLIYPGGAISGGSSKNHKNNLLGRDRKLEDLKEKIDSLEKKLDDISQKGLKLKNKIDEITNELNQENDDLHQIEIKINELQKDLKSGNERIEEYQEQINSLVEKIDKQKGKLNELKNKKISLEEEIEIINDGNYKNKDQVQKKEKELETLKEKADNLRDKITDLKVNLASLKQNKESKTNEKQELNERINTVNDKKQRLNDRIEAISNKLTDIDDREDELNSDRTNFKEQRDKLNIKVQKIESKLKDMKELINNWEDKSHKLQDELNEKRERSHQLDLRLNRLNNKQDRTKEKLKEEYDFSPQDEFEDRIKIDNMSRVERKTKELKSSIKKLKPVNLGAVDEYEELKSRLDYLTEQREDLIKARDSINKVIENIEENMSEQFYDTYLEVKERFETIFQQLFSGGTAQLNLTDPDNLLETGVEINAQPPGKKLKKLSLMSGGERALTAIALVFAFLKVNPSPFYILDEIDAPLDDSNVARFAQFLKRYSEFAQFILVTHSKHMMTEVETIYGVTMEESGISKLVSLRLDEKIS